METLKITGVLLIGMMIFLQGCGVREDSHATLTAQMTPIQIPSITPTSEPTLEPVLMYFPQTKTEFDRPDAILFAVSPGIAQWYDISIINTDGTALECITCETSAAYDANTDYYFKFRSPAWAPDGSAYAYVISSLPWNGILVRRKKTPDLVLVSEKNVWYDEITISPDSRYIAYTTGSIRMIDSDKTSICYMDLNLSNPENAEKHCVAPEKSNRYPSWSPGSKKIVFSASARNGGTGIYNNSPTPANLYIWDVENQNTVKFTDTSNAKLTPKWSPDGSKLAYILRDNTTFKYSLWVANADDTGQARIGGDEDIFDFDWSPDGKRIAFTQMSPIKNEGCDMGCLPFTILKIINLDTGAITSLTDGTQWIGDPAWKP